MLIFKKYKKYNPNWEIPAIVFKCVWRAILVVLQDETKNLGQAKLAHLRQ